MSDANISFTINNQSLTMAPGCIDVDVLHDGDMTLARGWLRLARNAIDEKIQERFAYYLQRPADAFVLWTQRNYCSDDAKDMAERFAATRKRSRFLFGLIYIATRYKVTCHELLFGMKRPIELFGRTKSFVTTVGSLQDEEFKKKLIDYLKSNFLNTNSPLYIVKQRCFEAGYAQGMREHDIYRLDMGSPTMEEMMHEMYAPNFSHRAEDYTGTCASHLPAFDMILRDCRKYRVSADYLLLQDYSDRALLDGCELTVEEQEWLSIYLCASPNAQITAVGMLMKHQLNQSAP